ncbi:MAG TPA: response regulator transcription factor [Solirubrobacteraceae bacterium]
MQSPTSTTRILLADDTALFRTAIAELIGTQEDLEVVGEAENGLEAVEKARALKPDVVVMDIEMPVMDGVEGTRLIREQVPNAKVVMLTVSDSDDHLFDAIRFGAHGYLLKNLRPAELFSLIRAVMRDESPLSPAIAKRLLGQIRDGTALASLPVPPSDAPTLTRRELEVLQLVADGLSNKEIATSLFITEGTVKNHIHNSLEKLQLENRTQAAAYIVRHGLGRGESA